MSKSNRVVNYTDEELTQAKTLIAWLLTHCTADERNEFFDEAHRSLSGGEAWLNEMAVRKGVSPPSL